MKLPVFNRLTEPARHMVGTAGTAGFRPAPSYGDSYEGIYTIPAYVSNPILRWWFALRIFLRRQA
jgi:hypothetical protein